VAGTIVVGYDGSDCAKAALRAAGEAAAAFGDRVLVVYGFGVAPMAEAADHRELLRRAGDQLVADALEQLKPSGVEATTELVDDRPADALIRAAAEHSARMIAVGTHGESPLAGALLGSVPHKLVHRSTIPVLVVPAEA
jgi:nucleotide-binding universal stress UspA family protein